MLIKHTDIKKKRKKDFKNILPEDLENVKIN